MNRVGLALKLLWRDSRSGELTLLVLALLIAVSSATAISLFANRLQRTMVMQAAEFLAGDLVIAAPEPVNPDWLTKAEQSGLARAQTVEFASVLLENNEMLLAAVKAVSPTYPLRGQLKIEDETSGEAVTSHGPEAGTAWVDKRVLTALKLKLGDKLTVGEQPVTITHEIRYEPDKRGDFYSFSPRVLINQADLEATGVVQPGSRVRYAFQFIGSENALATYRDWLKPQLNPSQKILDIHDDRPELGSALERAERYLGLSSIVVILIAGVAIAMATSRYTERHFNATALLRCLGCRQSEIIWLYGIQFLVLGLVGSALGCGLGWLAQFALFEILRSLLPQQLASASWLALALGFLTGFVILIGFALPPLLRLRNVSSLRVLRRELEPLPASGWLIYGLAGGLIAVLVWRYTGDARLTGIILGGSLLTLLVVSLLIQSLMRAGRPLLPHLGLSWRFGLQGLLRNSQASTSQIMAFCITLTAMGLSFAVRNDLVQNWQKQLPEQAPNHFAINILPDKEPGFRADLAAAKIDSSRFYPIVRGRLVEVNFEPVQQRTVKDSSGENATTRELSLTWTDQLPDDNRVIAGGAWQNLQPGLVSIEQKLADSLKIQVGDQLVFTVGDARFQATVANLRSVQWDTLKPNFFMIFSPGTLDNFPTTYMTSFYLAPEQKSLLTTLMKKFPAITILEVDQILLQFKTILAQLTQAINLLLHFALAAGFTVLFASVYATLDQRVYEGALMRTLGARRGFLRKSHLIEFSLLGCLAGALAALAAEAILYALYTRLLHIEYRPSFYLWGTLPAIGGLAVGIAGFWGVRPVVRQPPIVVLRR